MAISSDTIEQEVLTWPAAKRIKLAEKLMASVEVFATPEIEAVWNTERRKFAKAGRKESLRKK